MWYRVLACALVIALLAGRAGAQTPRILGFLNIETLVAVRLAVEGAAARLARSRCQQVFADFEDQSGQPISTKLATSGKRPVDAFGSLQFLDDRGAPQCRRKGILAFTRIGSSSIRVCSVQFRLAFKSNRQSTEIIMIHEFLHALGLGEDPPPSEAITQQVYARCGD